MNVNISKSEYTEHWHKTVVCDRCKRIIASAQCNKKPREDEVSICRDCAVEMWTKEKDNEIRRLKRALWLARSYRGRDNSILLPSKFMRNVWDNVERKCIKKAEEYK